MNNVIYAVGSLSAMGLIFGALLAYASKVFAVEVDERVTQIQEVLPGANCGGCGFAGCGALADAIVKGNAKTNACPVGGDDCADKIAQIMGVTSEKTARQVAHVMCNGVDGKAVKRFNYDGIVDCSAAMRYGQGDKACGYSCVGYGTCVRACQFGAISIVDGVAVVDKEKCTACGMCKSSCPRNVIKMVPYASNIFVTCNSKDKGAVMKQKCSVGCIGCKLCEKACKYDAIHVVDNNAAIDYDKCTECGACVAKCPKKIILMSAESSKPSEAAATVERASQDVPPDGGDTTSA